MLEESVSSSSPTFWAGLNSWFTPTVFFVVLQLVIGTIYISSTLANNNHNHNNKHQEENQLDPQQHQHQAPLARSPSLLQRFKSINFHSPYSYRSQDPYYYNNHHHNNNNNNHELLQTLEQPQQQLPRSPSLLQRFKSINFYSYFPTEPLSSKLTPTSHDNTDNVVVATSTITTTHELPQHHHVYDEAVAVETDEEEGSYEDGDEADDVVGKMLHHNKIDDDEYAAAAAADDVSSSSMDEIYSKLQGQDGHFIRTQSDTKPASGEVPVKLPKKMKKSASSKSAFSHFKEDDIVERRRPATVREKKVTANATATADNEVDAKADDFINKFKQQLKLQRLDSIMKYKEVIGRGGGK
ncbi:hypothetical protein RIF29_05810 [Crotalaria pallida]|uniref:DUF4408 domain-containing protein n=1 Tax=Crotalaria pallida TaxID=3830 RepID=A0AAN9P9Z0_CROPI